MTLTLSLPPDSLIIIFGEIIALIQKIIFPKQNHNNLKVSNLTLFNYKKVYHFLLHLYYFRNFVLVKE